MSAEFDYLAELADSFFSLRHTQKSLSLIHNHGITGWEIWLQVEFAHFLSMHESSPEWWREETLDYDRRMEKEKSFLRPDFLIRKKGWKRESYFALELKQHPVATTCISNMVKDMRRIEKLRRSSIDLRAYWLLGIYFRESKTQLADAIADALASCDYQYDSSRVVNKFVRNTPYGYCIF